MTDFLLHQRWQGACLETDPELHFPASETRHFAEQITRAKAVCDSCPVIAACRAHGLANEEFGIWGGLTESERRGARRATIERELAATPTAAKHDPASVTARQDRRRDRRHYNTDQDREYEAARTQLQRAKDRLRVLQRAGADEAAAAEVRERIAQATQRVDNAKAAKAASADRSPRADEAVA